MHICIATLHSYARTKLTRSGPNIRTPIPDPDIAMPRARVLWRTKNKDNPTIDPAKLKLVPIAVNEE